MPLLISLLLWFYATPISKWLWRKNQIADTYKSPTASQIQVVLFSSIGVYLFLSAFPDVVEVFVYLAQKMAGDLEFISLSDYAHAVGYLVRMVISVWLIFGSDRIVRGLQNRQILGAK